MLYKASFYLIQTDKEPCLPFLLTACYRFLIILFILSVWEVDISSDLFYFILFYWACTPFQTVGFQISRLVCLMWHVGYITVLHCGHVAFPLYKPFVLVLFVCAIRQFSLFTRNFSIWSHDHDFCDDHCFLFPWNISFLWHDSNMNKFL